MNPTVRARRFVWSRRIVQGSLLGLFLLLLWGTRDVEGKIAGSWLKLFFAIDPLILLSAWIARHPIEGIMLLAFATVALTLALGRVFCGWICPLGTLHQTVSWLRTRKRDGRIRIDAFSRWQRAKYFLLIALVVMAVLGMHWIGVFDPASLLYRSVGTAFLPVTMEAAETAAADVYREDPNVGPIPLTSITEPVHRVLRDGVFRGGHPVFFGAGAILLIFFAAVVLNLHRPRFWCRYLCPLGALLGLLAKRTTLRLASTSAGCNECGICAMNCPAAAQPEKEGEWLPTECFGCWNCVASCQRGGLDFRFESPLRRPAAGSIDLTRRATVASVLGGVGGAMLLRATPWVSGRTYHPFLIRPPGALPESRFLQRCIQCGMCMKVCPPNALHPAAFEAGLAGIWSPILVPRIGYCDYQCNLCGQICPTGAIQPLPVEEKKRVFIGLAVIDTTRCLPYAYDRECIVCEEHCPIPTKAIYFVPKEIHLRDGSIRTLKMPKVDPDLCNGCGICETKCPFRDVAAIRVTSANETRHPGNRPFLPSAPRSS